MSKSIYGGGGSRTMALSTHQIYGNVTTGVDTTQCCTAIHPSVAPTAILQQLVAIIGQLKTAIEKFYPPSEAVSQFVGQMNMRIGVPFVIYVRLAWIEVYGTQTVIDIDGSVEKVSRKFDSSSEVDRLQLKDLYLAGGRDWRTDPMFIKMGLV